MDVWKGWRMGRQWMDGYSEGWVKWGGEMDAWKKNDGGRAG